MSIKIPELILQDTLDNILAFIKADYDAAIAESDSALYKLWNGVIHGNYDFFEQSKAVFLKTNADQRKIKIRPNYPTQIQDFPLIIINVPGENKGSIDGIGVDENLDTAIFDDDALTFTDTKTRSFDFIYSIIIFSDNRNEVILIYHTLKAFFTLLHEHLTYLGIENLKISGKELQIMNDIVPKNCFIKAIQLSGFTSLTVEDIFSNSMVQNFTFSGTPIESNIEFS